MLAHMFVTGFLLVWSSVSLVSNLLTRQSLSNTIAAIVQLKHLDDFPEAQATIAGREISTYSRKRFLSYSFLAGQSLLCVVLLSSFFCQALGMFGSVSENFDTVAIVVGYAAWSFYWLIFLLIDLWFYVWLPKPTLQNSHLILFGIGICLLSVATISV